MKILTGFCLLLLCTAAQASKLPGNRAIVDSSKSIYNSNTEDTTIAVQLIKKRFAAINQAVLTKKSFTWETDTTCDAPPMGGSVTYFYKGTELVKIFNEGGEDHGSWKEEYYFDQGKLIFVYQNNTYGGAANPDEVAYQNRYYFRNDRLLKRIESSEDVQAADTAIQQLIQTVYGLTRAKNAAAIARVFSCVPAN